MSGKVIATLLLSNTRGMPQPPLRCNSCRERNTRCDRKVPCGTCLQHRRTCNYRKFSLRCEPCRRAHRGCDGDYPVCGSCREVKKSCSWSNQDVLSGFPESNSSTNGSGTRGRPLIVAKSVTYCFLLELLYLTLQGLSTLLHL